MSEHDLEQSLAAVPIFAGLSKRQLRKLLDASRTTRHHQGHEIAREGEGSLALHLVLSGTAEVTKQGEHVRQLRPGDYFGEISMIDGKKRSATVTAEESLETLAVPHAAFAGLLESDPTVAAGLLQLLCARLREAEST